MSNNQNSLYNFLPAIYRQRDKEQGEPLRALMAIFEKELHTLEADFDQAYANQFVETCQLPFLAFIGDLLGVSDLHHQTTILPGIRRLIANSLRYNRNKGQGNVIERIAEDVTDWPAKLVHYNQLLAITQNIKTPRLNQGKTALIRDMEAMDVLGTAFEQTAHTAEIFNHKGEVKYNLGETGLFLWRLRTYQKKGGYAGKVADGRYRFHPFLYDIPLFNNPKKISDLSYDSVESDLPTPIRLNALLLDLENYRKKYAALAVEARPQNSTYYGPNASINIVKVIQAEEPATGVIKEQVSPINVFAANLSEWVLPVDADDDAVFIDPQLGRIALPPSLDADAPEILRLEVDYYYGFSGDLGGGHYNRINTLVMPDSDTYFVKVSKNPDLSSIATIQAALSQWNNLNNKPKCIIEIVDDATYEENTESLNLVLEGMSNKSNLTIQAGDGYYPSLHLIWEEEGPSELQLSSEEGSLQVTLSGLLFWSFIKVSGNVQLAVKDCTAISIYSDTNDDDSSQLQVSVENSLFLGRILLLAEAMQLTVKDSILLGIFGEGDVIGSVNEDEPGPRTHLERVTLFGPAHVLELAMLSESIITNTVISERTDSGCIRYSYLPMESKTPLRYRCQPELDYIPSAKKRAQELGLSDEDELPEVEKQLILQKLMPHFTADDFESIFYPRTAQLNSFTNPVILAGAEDGKEMGAFLNLNQPQLQLIAQLTKIADEYLPYSNGSVKVEFAT